MSAEQSLVIATGAKAARIIYRALLTDYFPVDVNLRFLRAPAPMPQPSIPVSAEASTPGLAPPTISPDPRRPRPGRAGRKRGGPGCGLPTHRLNEGRSGLRSGLGLGTRGWRLWMAEGRSPVLPSFGLATAVRRAGWSAQASRSRTACTTGPGVSRTGNARPRGPAAVHSAR